MAPVAALTAAQQQMATTMARIDARLDQLSTAVTNPAKLPAPTDANTQVATTQQPPAPITNPPTSGVVSTEDIFRQIDALTSLGHATARDNERLL
ncbi:hypothetical protein PF008_g32202 [Phytophthora fragariae]|uniref:Uncharacterized protein n=1 Tax=Phytophthora fragariae TaxID=53985 RepID=A0A6G0Q0K0_9STRA|nr:hypothetical protein PF008_g32202 [Phytophthora fragariae]